MWLWLWSCRLPVLWFGLVNAWLPLPCRVAHAAGHMAACRGALGRLRPGLARSNRPGTGRGTESAAGSRTEPCRASPLVLVLPSARLWRLGADRQCGPLEPTTRAGLPLVVTMAWSVSDPSGTGRGSLQPASYRPLMLALTFDRHKNQIVQANLIVSLQTSNLGHTNRKIPLNCPTTVASVPGRCSFHSDCQTRQRLWLCYVD